MPSADESVDAVRWGIEFMVDVGDRGAGDNGMRWMRAAA